MTRTPVSTNGTFTSIFLLTFYKLSQLHKYCEFQHDFFQESSLGYSNTYSYGKMYKTYHFVCFFNFLANVQISPRQFLPVFGLGVVFTISWRPWPLQLTCFLLGDWKFSRFGNFKKKINEIGPCLLYFKNIWKFYVFGGRKRPVGTWWVKLNWHCQSLVIYIGWY